jgi:hypothetical protein
MAPWVAAACKVFCIHPLLLTSMALEMGYQFSTLQDLAIEGKYNQDKVVSL